MRSATIFLGLITSCYAAALPNSGASNVCKTSVDASFDDIATGLVDTLNPVPSPYNYLVFKGFTVAPSGLVSTIAPHSSPNSIAFNLANNVVKGTPTFTTKYSGSSASYFNLKQLYIGCVTVNPAGVYLPSSCTVQATGIKTDGSKVYQPLTFTAPLLPSNLPVVSSKKTQEQLQKFPSSFTNLQTVTFEVTSAGVAVAVTAVSFDNVEYDVYHKCSN